jgi:quercetin dioxygenase-like cupin family protein
VSTTLNRALVSQANLGNSRWYPPHLFSHLVGSEASEGEVMLIQFHGKAGGEPPLHVHTQEDEFFYILDGSFVFESGGVQMQAKPGTFVWFPKNVEHGFRVYTETGKGLIGFLPGAMEQWFIDYSTPADFMNLPPEQIPNYLLDLESMIRSGNELGVQFLPPTVTSTKANPAADSQPFARHRDDVGVVTMPGMRFSFLAKSGQTGGKLTAFELALDPGVSIPFHTKSEIEVDFVLEGQVRYQLGDTLVEAGPGTSLLVPRGTEYGYRNVGPKVSRVLHIVCGGTFDVLCGELQPLFQDPAANAALISATLERHGARLLAPEISG